MRKMNTLLTAVAVMLFASCNFSKGVKKDLTTGLRTTWNGFSVDEVYLSDTSGNHLTSNIIKLGNTILITATGIENYQLKGGKAFPGCTLSLTDDSGNSILNINDAFASLSEGVSENDSRTLTASFTTGKPMEIGKTYHIKARFYDKEKTSNEIVSTCKIVME